MEKIAGLICANYETHELGVLTDDRTIATLPYGGRYRMIDFALSNMVSSGIQSVGLITPYKYRSIFDHIGAGKDWSLDRKVGGLFVLPGSTFGISGSRSRFLLRDLMQNDVFLKRSLADFVVLTSVDNVYSMDYRPMIEAHEKSGADVTLLYNVSPADAPEYPGLVLEGNRVTEITPGVKAGDAVFACCMIISRILLLNMLEWYARVGHLDILDVLQFDHSKMDIRAYEFPGYIRRINDQNEYYRYSMELLRPEVQDELFFSDRPVYTKVRNSVPTKYLNGSATKNSLVSPGCLVKGTVENSILFRNVKVETGAVVRNSIIMQSCVIGAGSIIENAIIDRGNVIASGTILRGTGENTFVLGKKRI